MTIGIGIVGCGFIGAFHAYCIRKLVDDGLVDARTVAVTDVDPERAATFVQRWGYAKTATDAEALAADPAIDVVYVCVPTVAHAEAVGAAASNGKAVFCEKPLAFDAPRAEEMAAAVHKAGVAHQVGLVLRFSPTMRELRRRLRSDDDGRLMTIVMRDDQFFPITGHYGSTWHADAAISGAGTMIEHSIHDVDILAFLAGPIVSVQAVTRNFAGHPGVEDLGTVLVEFAGGATATLTSVWHEVHMRPSLRRLEVFREKALYETEHDTFGPITVTTSDARVTIDADVSTPAAVAELGGPEELASPRAIMCLSDWAFLDAVSRGGTPEPGFEAAVAAHRVIDAVYASAAEDGRRVTIAPA